jgi:hypothetical protein
MRTLFVFLSILLSFSQLFPNSVSAEGNYTTISLSPRGNLSRNQTYRDFPKENIVFKNIPFNLESDDFNYFASHNNACLDCPKTFLLDNLSYKSPSKVWLLVNSSNSFQGYSQKNFGYIELEFNDDSVYRYDFKLGENVREWNQFGPTVNSVNNVDSTEIWRGVTLTNLGPIVVDLLEIKIPIQYDGLIVTDIKLTDASNELVGSHDPGLVLNGITFDYLTIPVEHMLQIESSWDTDGRQVPIDRVADITVKVTDANGNLVPDASVSARVSQNDVGQFESIIQTTNSQGEAFFRYTPSQQGVADLLFTAKGVESSLKLNIYRPPIVIVPGMLASFNAMKFFIDDFDQANWKWSSTAEQGWDETISMLKNNNYVENEDYSIAFYDWRKTLNSQFYTRKQIEPVYKNLYPAIDNLLQNRPSGQKVNILAHSFGGLLTRSMIQNNLDRERINQFVTFATPHHGASAAYYPWQGGVTATGGDPISGSLLNLIMKVYTNRSGESGVAFFRSKFASIKNLLPTYDYIRHGSTPILSNDLIHQNDVLLNTMNTNNFKASIDSKNIRFTAFYSSDEKTLDSITTFTPTPNSDTWPDGQPFSSQDKIDGDNVVLPKSATIPQLPSQKVTGVHGDIPDNSRQYVSNLLKINPHSTPGKKSPLSFLWVMVLSPAYAEILNSEGNVISTRDDWDEVDVKNSFATNLVPGIYSIKVTGTGSGAYTAYVPYFSSNSKYEKEYYNVTYPGKVDWIDMFIGDDKQTNTSQLVRTRMLLLPDLASLIKRKLLINSVFDLPKDYDSSQLKLTTVWLNGKILPVQSSSIDKKLRKLTIQIPAKDFANAIDWKESEINIRMVVPGNEISLFGEKLCKIRWSDYKNQL